MQDHERRCQWASHLEGTRNHRPKEHPSCARLHRQRWWCHCLLLRVAQEHPTRRNGIDDQKVGGQLQEPNEELARKTQH